MANSIISWFLTCYVFYILLSANEIQKEYYYPIFWLTLEGCISFSILNGDSTFSLILVFASQHPNFLIGFTCLISLRRLWSVLHLKIFNNFWFDVIIFGVFFWCLYCIYCFAVSPHFYFQRALFVQRQGLLSQCYFPGTFIYKIFASFIFNLRSF